MSTVAASASGSGSALFGFGALQVDYKVIVTEESGSSFVDFGYVLGNDDQGGTHHNCFGADYISLWYKIMTPSSHQDTQLRFILYDDSNCNDDCNSYDGSNVEQYVSVHHILRDSEEWKELRIPLEASGDSNSNSPITLTETEGLGDIGQQGKHKKNRN